MYNRPAQASTRKGRHRHRQDREGKGSNRIKRLIYVQRYIRSQGTIQQTHQVHRKCFATRFQSCNRWGTCTLKENKHTSTLCFTSVKLPTGAICKRYFFSFTSSWSCLASSVCAFLKADILRPQVGLSAKFLLYGTSALASSIKANSAALPDHLCEQYFFRYWISRGSE